MMRRLAVFIWILVLPLIGGCAVTPPFSGDELQNAALDLSPEQGAADGARGAQALWGGVILSVANHRDRTDFQVLSYPLDDTQRPIVDSSAHKRFIVHHKGYLEAVLYAAGREITVLGTVQAAEDGKVGAAAYRFPVIDAERIHLWPPRQDSRVHFGVGLGIGVHM